MNARIRTAILLLLVGLGAGVAAHPVSGQEAATTPLFLALPEVFPDLDARVALMREPGRNIVVLNPEDASPETLQIALMLLRRLEREHGQPTDRGQLVPITGFVARSEIEPARRAHLVSLLAELEGRPLSNVGNLGWGRWMAYREP